jgi:hypothetical protein
MLTQQSCRSVLRAHSTPDPDLPDPTPSPMPDDVPSPTNAPVQEPTLPAPPIKTAALTRPAPTP